MLASRLFFGTISFAIAGLLAIGCGATVTSVGAIDAEDASTSSTSEAGTTADTGGGSDADPSDAHLQHDADGSTTCAAGECGAKVCGRDECGHVCGVCAASPPQGGCFMGKCNTSCPGTPCLDHDGHHICEGERGGRSCAGGTLHIEVCTCSGGGANGWINCGACL